MCLKRLSEWFWTLTLKPTQDEPAEVSNTDTMRSMNGSSWSEVPQQVHHKTARDNVHEHNAQKGTVWKEIVELKAGVYHLYRELLEETCDAP